MQKKTLVIAIAGAAILFGGFQLYNRAGSDGAAPDIHTATASAELTQPKKIEIRPAEVLKRQDVKSPEQLKANYQAFMANRPLYLADTELPAEYSVDEDGNLIVDSAVKDILDYFMLTIGDLPFDQIYDLLAGNMHASLEEPALSQALAVLENYFSYIDAYDVWEKGFEKDQMMASNPQGLKTALQEQENLRRQHLGDEVYDAFFAEEAQTNAAYLDAQIALKQTNLTDAERARIVQTLEQSLPESVREAQQAAMAQVNLAEKTRTLVSNGASEQEIHQARVEMVGEEAANRLQAVDNENRVWEQKRAQYKAMFTSVPGADGLSAAERAEYIADIAQKELGLSANEIKRMQALDRIEAAQSVQ